MSGLWEFFGLDADVFAEQFTSVTTVQQLEFANPAAFAILIVVLLFAVLHWARPAKTDWQQSASAKSMLFRHPLIEKLGFSGKVKTQSNIWRWALHGLRWILLLLLVVSLAKPQKEVPLPPEPQSKTVRDIVFVVESSVTFVLEDYELNGQPTSRLEVVKSVIDQFVSALDGNRFGVILYAEEAFTLMPLTTDAVTTRLMLKRLKPYLAGRTDEAMGEGLGLALQQAENNTETTQKRIVVLISDGQSMPSRIPISEAINYAQGLDLPIYTVGVGAGSVKADKRAFRGLVYEALESDSLKKLATETNGQYYQIGSGADLQSVLRAIDQSEGVKIDKPRTKTQIIEFYPYFAVLTLLTFVIYFVLVQLLANRLKPKTMGGGV